MLTTILQGLALIAKLFLSVCIYSTSSCYFQFTESLSGKRLPKDIEGLGVKSGDCVERFLKAAQDVLLQRGVQRVDVADPGRVQEHREEQE